MNRVARPDFTICVLLYGDHYQLAQRCLSSIIERLPRNRYELRIGLNAVCRDTMTFVQAAAQRGLFQITDVYESTENILKYPMMRRMLYDPDNRIDSKYLIWFDDDSYLDYPAGVEYDWFSKVENLLQDNDLLGAIYQMPFGGGQREWVKAQPWYTGKSPDGRKLTFATGGWWATHPEHLYRVEYPWTELTHNGGDTMLSECFFQQGLKVTNFREGVRINADEIGRESKAARRGLRDGRPIGYDYVASAASQAGRLLTPPVRTSPRKRIDLDV